MDTQRSPIQVSLVSKPCFGTMTFKDGRGLFKAHGLHPTQTAGNGEG
jgi:hypothetical protein